MPTATADFTIRRAAFAKGRFVIIPTADGSCYKTRAGRLVEALGGRWIHRDHGYQVSAKCVERFGVLYAEGWDGGSFSRQLIPPSAVV